MTAQKLSCGELVELVTDYLEGHMPGETRARFEAHLDGCRGCRAYLRQVETTVRLAAELCDDDVRPAARDELLAAFRGWRSAP